MPNINVELLDQFFRFQTGEIPVNGILADVILELCHKYAIVETATSSVLGSSPGEGIINLGTVAELDAEFPGFAEWMDNIKIALITKASQIIAARQAPPPAEETPTPE